MASGHAPQVRPWRARARPNGTSRSATPVRSPPVPPGRPCRSRRPRTRSSIPMTRRFLHTDPWSSLLDAWSEACPRLRYTISVRDDRLPSKQAARRAPPNSAVASAACLESPGARYSICGCIGHPAFPAPSIVKSGETVFARLGPIAPPEREVVFGVAVIARSAAAKQSTLLPAALTMDCFAEPVIGRAFARPVGSHDGLTVTSGFVAAQHGRLPHRLRVAKARNAQRCAGFRFCEPQPLLRRLTIEIGYLA